MASKWKCEGTLFSLKAYLKMPAQNQSKWPYLSHKASKWKFEGTLFPSTFKGLDIAILCDFGYIKKPTENILKWPYFAGYQYFALLLFPLPILR